MMKSKKAQFFVGFIVIMTFFALLSALIVLSSKYNVENAFGGKRIIGEKQAELFNLYQRGENARFYIEKASEIAALNTINNLSKEKSGCDVYLGYSVWSTKDKKCVPNAKIVSEKFNQEFSNKLNDLLSKYNDIKLTGADYELIVSKNLTIIGKSKSELDISSGLASGGQLIADSEVQTIWPADGFIAGCYGARTLVGSNGKEKEDWHDGIDLGIVIGTPLKAAAAGTVVVVDDKWVGGCSCCIAPGCAPNLCSDKACFNRNNYPGSGNSLVIKHNDEFYTRYSHLSKILKKVGDQVSQGEVVAESGNTGYTFGPHLHFEVYFTNVFAPDDAGKGSYERNPLCYLPQKPFSDFKGDSCHDGDGIGGCGDSPTSSAYSSASYSFDTNFNATVNYSFSEYQQINESMQRISEKVSQSCKPGEKYGECVTNLLNDKQITGDFKFTFQCGQKAPVSKLLLVCAESKYTFMNVNGKKEPFLYRIAYFLGDTVFPNPVEGLTLVDTLKQEKNLTVSFNANSEPDIDGYNVYYSTQDFSNIKEERTEENRIKFLTSVKDTKSNIKTTINISEDNVYYYFAVTPIDKSGNENPAVKTVQTKSDDDLYPGMLPQQISFDKRPIGNIPVIGILITPPTNNEDGSDLKDLAGYAVYLRDANDATTCDVSDLKAIILVSNNKKTVQFDMTSSPNIGTLELPDANKGYCLVAIPVDEVGNTIFNDKRDSKFNTIFVKI